MPACVLALLSESSRSSFRGSLTHKVAQSLRLGMIASQLRLTPVSPEVLLELHSHIVLSLVPGAAPEMGGSYTRDCEGGAPTRNRRRGKQAGWRRVDVTSGKPSP